jgi:ethanolamine-phosphate cytidylyltransferase
MYPNLKEKEKIIVYVDGVFDLFHAGHIQFLKKAKSLGTYLIVGVISDEACQSYKRKPIIDLNNRIIMVENIKIVDKVVTKSPLIFSTIIILLFKSIIGFLLYD